MIGRGKGELSVARRCALLGVARSSAYCRPTGDSEEELALMERIDRIFTEHPMYGSRRMQVMLARDGTLVGRRRIRRLMRRMGLCGRWGRGVIPVAPIRHIRSIHTSCEA